MYTLKSCNVRSSYHLGLGLLTITSTEVGWPGKYQGTRLEEATELHYKGYGFREVPGGAIKVVVV